MRYLIVLLSMVLAINAGAQQPAPKDGNQWRSITTAQKIGWTIGFHDGIESGLISTAIPVDEVAKLSQADLEQMVARWSNLQAKFEAEWRGITVGQLIDAMDLFYADSANRLIGWSAALNLSLARINGMSKEELDKATELSRSKSKPK